MDRTPILQIGEFLLVSLQDPSDDMASALLKELAERLAHSGDAGARGVLLDLSTMKTVDAFLGRFLGKLISLARIMKTEAVIVGMQPAVALTLVEMDITLPGALTAVNMDRAREVLQVRMKEDVKKD